MSAWQSSARDVMLRNLKWSTSSLRFDIWGTRAQGYLWFGICVVPWQEQREVHNGNRYTMAIDDLRLCTQITIWKTIAEKSLAMLSIWRTSLHSRIWHRHSKIYRTEHPTGCICKPIPQAFEAERLMLVRRQHISEGKMCVFHIISEFWLLERCTHLCFHIMSAFFISR